MFIFCRTGTIIHFLKPVNLINLFNQQIFRPVVGSVNFVSLSSGHTGFWEIKVSKQAIKWGKKVNHGCSSGLGNKCTNYIPKFGPLTVQDDHRAVSIKAASWCDSVLIFRAVIKGTFVVWNRKSTEVPSRLVVYSRTALLLFEHFLGPCGAMEGREAGDPAQSSRCALLLRSSSSATPLDSLTSSGPRGLNMWRAKWAWEGRGRISTPCEHFSFDTKLKKRIKKGREGAQPYCSCSQR